MHLWRYAFAFEGCVGNGMRLGNACALELFEGLVKDYGVCVWTYAFALEICVGLMRLVDAFRYAFGLLLLSIVFFVMFDPIGDLFIEPLLSIVSNDSVNFCLTFLVKYDKGGSSSDFLDFAFFICDLEPFGYVLIVYNSQWKGFRIYGIIIFWCNLFVEGYTVYAITHGKH